MGTERSQDRTVWSGWDRRGGVDAVEGLTAFADGPRRPDEERYELTAVAARGFRPPKLLVRTAAQAETSSEVANATEPDDRSGAFVRKVWSLVYRPLASASPLDEAAYAIYLLGVDAPGDAHDEEVRAFEDFYVNVHVREVAERRGALRAVPHRLVDVVKAPYKGAPTFLTAYELDERSASVRRHTGPPYRPGPDVWQRHSTPWRLWYQRLPPTDR